MTIWVCTVAFNLILCLILLFRGHFERYRILFTSLIYELFAAAVLWFAYQYFGISSPAYDLLFRTKKTITIAFEIGIIFEGWTWRNKALRIPQEVYLSVLLVSFVTEKLQFFLVSDVIYNTLRYANLAILGWFIYIFSKEKFHERREFHSQSSTHS